MLNYQTRIINYSLAKYPLRALVARHFLSDLTMLHEKVGTLPRLQVGKEKTALHEHFYEGDATFRRLFESVYINFMREVVLEGEDPAYYLLQRVPSFRVHLPGNVATGNFHRDADFGHQYEELNVLVALTDMEGSNSVWLESEPGAKDFAPVTLSVGQALIFHGAILEHGSHPNQTGRTRVSFDARILPRAAYQPGGMTVNNPMALRIGEYWV